VEELFRKMKEYLKMDTEISFHEFSEYYNKVMDYMQANFEEMEQEDKVKAKFILTIVSSNSAVRAKSKGSEMKKYRKMQDKTSFWSGAVNYSLLKTGMSQQEIDEAVKELEESATHSCDFSHENT
jgi:hypothetical protein